MGLQNLQTSFWDKLDAWVIAIISTVTAIFAMLGTFVTWCYDRRRITLTEEEIVKIKAEIQKNEIQTAKNFNDMRKSHDDSTKRVLDKIDELKYFLMNKKINERGDDEDKQNI
jgi:predicted RNA-binding protein with EMAP domain